MQNRYLYLFSLLMATIDISIVNISIFMAFSLSATNNTQLHYEDFFIILNLLWVICSKVLDLYEKKTIQMKLFIVTTIKCICLHLIALLIYFSITAGSLVTGSLILVFYTSLCLIVLLSRFCMVQLAPVLKSKFKMTSPIALIGVNPTSLQLASFFEKNQKLYNFAGFLNPVISLPENGTDHLTPVIKDQMKQAADTGINEVYVSLAPDKIGEIDHLIKEANKQCVRLKFIPDFSQFIHAPLNIRSIGDLTVISLTGADAQEEMHNRFIKRIFDVVISSMVIVFILSWLYPILALLIKLESPGPVIFKQYRSGRNNVNFWCYKFRSMTVNQDSHNKQASRNDGRITRIGGFLRKTSLDEFPQFFNVLLGNMSIVGPRPHMLKHTEQYRNLIDKYMVRHYLKPGITGWAQINGFRGETRELDLMEKRIKYDIWYLENWSAYLDLKIIFLTILHVIKGDDNAF